MSENITNNPSVPTQVVAEVKFPQFINNLGIIPTSYKDSMSYYETLAWLCKYLEETVIPTVNQNGEAVQDLQGLYIQLNNYVTHYFDNLDVQEEINNKLDEMVENGTFQEIIGEYFALYITPEMYGAIGDGETDDTQAFNNALSSLTNGGLLLLKPNKNYKITDTINVPANVSIQGINTFNDISGKGDYVIDDNILKGMSIISIVDNGEFILQGNNDIEKVVISYPEQNYEIQQVTKSVGNPDGLTNFIKYKPTFKLTGTYIGLVFKDIIYLGGYEFLYCDYTVNPEKLMIDRVIGMCVGTAFTIQNCKDMMYFQNIHLNTNSLKPYVQKLYNGSDINFYTKCAKNSVVFSFGATINNVNYGCDGSYISNCFAYGVKRFIEMNGEGNSPQLNNCGCDVCHEFLYINSNVKPFGTYLNNIFCTPIVYKSIKDNVETNESPCLIRIDNGKSDHKIKVNNVTVFGSASSLFVDSNKCNYVFEISENSQNTRIDVVNAKFTANNLQSGFNVIGNNNISQAQPNSYKILTLLNSTLNGNDIDSNINQSKTIYVTRVAGEGEQVISGIGFKPSTIIIKSCLGLSHKNSFGTSDGVTSKAISQTESGVQITSGGNAIIQQWATDLSNRYDGEITEINNDGFKITWTASGSNLPEGTFGMIITCLR